MRRLINSYAAILLHNQNGAAHARVCMVSLIIRIGEPTTGKFNDEISTMKNDSTANFEFDSVNRDNGRRDMRWTTEEEKRD